MTRIHNEANNGTNVTSGKNAIAPKQFGAGRSSSFS